MRTKEIRLANGRIIGHRDLRYIYKQKLRLPDEREAVIVNKLSLQYRMMNKKPGNRGHLMLSLEDQKGIKSGHVATYKESKRIVKDKYLANERWKKFEMQVGIKHNKTKMTFFRIACNV